MLPVARAGTNDSTIVRPLWYFLLLFVGPVGFADDSLHSITSMC